MTININTISATIVEQFKQCSKIQVHKDSNSSAYSSIFYEFDKIIANQIKNHSDIDTFYQCFLSPLKIYLITQSNDSINNVSKFLSKFLIYLNTPTTITTTTSNTSNINNINQRKLQIYELVISFLSQVLESKESIVRLRSLQILNYFFNDINFDITMISNNNKLLNQIISRYQDKNSNIRLIISNILLKLLNIYIKNTNNTKTTIKNQQQFNNNNTILIIQTLLDCLLMMLENDLMWTIRLNVLKNLSQYKNQLIGNDDNDDDDESKSFLNLVLTRVKDVKDQIRIEALSILSNHFQFDNLSRDQIKMLLNSTFKDPNEKVVEYSGKMFCKWFSFMMDDGSCNNSGSRNNSNDENWIYRFLEFIGVEDENDEMLTTVLLSLFKQANVKEFSLNEVRELTLEQSFHCKLTFKYLKSLKSQDASDRLESLLPTLTEFMDILYNHLDSDPFTLIQLLKLLEYFDLSHDEVGRSNIQRFLRELLKVIQLNEDQNQQEKEEEEEEEDNDRNSINLVLIEQVLQCLSLLHKVERDFIVFIVEIISDFIEPLEEDKEILDKQGKINTLKKVLVKIEKTQPSEAEKVKGAIKTLEMQINDKQTETLKKCSIVTHFLLLNAKKCSNSPEIDGLLELVILPSIQHPLPDLRSLGIQNLGIFCLHRKKEALNYLKLFEKVIENDIESVSLTCLKVIFDILLVFGSPNKIPKETESLYKMIRKTFTNNNEDSGADGNNTKLKRINLEIKEISIQGFVKLLYAGIVYDSKILKFLLLELFSTSTLELLELRKCLQLFFQAYVSDILDNKKLLFDCIMDCFQTITNSPQQSPYSSINLIDFAKFVLSLLDKPMKKSQYSDTLLISGDNNHNDNNGNNENRDGGEDEEIICGGGGGRGTINNNNNMSSGGGGFNVLDCHPKLALSICIELISSFRGQSKEMVKILPLFKFDSTLHQPLLEKIYDQLEMLFNYYTDPILEKFHQSIIKLLSKEFLDQKSQSQSTSHFSNSRITSALTSAALSTSTTVISASNIIGNSNLTKSQKHKQKSQLFNTPIKKMMKLNGSSGTCSLKPDLLLDSLSKSNKNEKKPLITDYFKQQRNLLALEGEIDKSTPRRPSKKKLKPTTTNDKEFTINNNSSSLSTTQFFYPFLHKNNNNNTANATTNTSDSEISSSSSGSADDNNIDKKQILVKEVSNLEEKMKLANLANNNNNTIADEEVKKVNSILKKRSVISTIKDKDEFKSKKVRFFNFGSIDDNNNNNNDNNNNNNGNNGNNVNKIEFKI